MWQQTSKALYLRVDRMPVQSRRCTVARAADIRVVCWGGEQGDAF